MKIYNHEKIEQKWQKEWAKKKVFEAKDKSNKKKFYSLIEFPYPSGDGLHIGHIRSNTAMDIISRKRRMEGYNVLYPIGWDAFGLPTENYAIKTGIAPAVVTKQNTDTFRKQLKSIGFSFDWSREINTTDPKYYKWTQWIFLQFFKHDLAYKAKININWCPKDKIGLANEEVVNGCCERCGTPVEKREKEQWMLRITKYADRLDKDLDKVDYLEKIKIQQRNWIGKSEGAEIEFQISNFKFPNGDSAKIRVFTTRPDTIFGGTYVVLAPEHPIISSLESRISNIDEVKKYIAEAKNKTEIERTAEEKDKTGVELKGVKAINPATKEEIPIWIADFVLAHYGTGAVFADAHDKRDFEFAKKYKIPLKTTLKPKDEGDDLAIRNLEVCFEGKGILYDSGEFSGLTSEEAIPKMSKKYGKIVIKYKLRDWVFSRQRYWGEPIPVVHCQKCGIVPLKEKDLPLVLPKVEKYQPTDTGESPLATISKWVNTKCPKCGGKAKRETDTMPNWAGSSWYYLAYTSRGISNFQFPISNKNSKSKTQKNLKYWMTASPVRGREGSQRASASNGVDWYNGGMEHTTLHLLYSRFWNKFLYDIGVVPTSEPYKKRTSHGLILAKGGEKMSKSKGNVINPDQIVFNYGADTLRMYEMFMGPFSEAIAWGEENILGVRRFLERVWRIAGRVVLARTVLASNTKMSKGIFDSREYKKFEVVLHRTVKKVSEDIESMAFNTAISAMMILINEMEKQREVIKKDFEMFLKILSPFAPHIAEEIWNSLGHKSLIVLEKWPKADPKKMKELEIKIAVQVNSRVRAECVIPTDSDEEEVVTIAKTLLDVDKWLLGKEIKKVIYIKNKLLNFVVS